MEKSRKLYIYNTLTRKIEKLETLKENVCSIYSCGPTVYNYAHIGNFRYFLFVDLLRRTLKQAGYKLDHVINITDVGHLVSDADEGEDKMLKTARIENKSPEEIAKYYTKAFLEDSKKLNIDMPEKIVKATENIEEMEQYVQKLLENGYAYKTENTIYFDTSKLEKYGQLSKIDIEGQKAGARVELDKGKKNITDFALWIKAPESHIMKWDSFFGKAYPGWHIECSAMSNKYIGEVIDIHTGGADHISVHHENEIAQSMGYSGKMPANYWMHSEFLQVDGGKMSKSLGNTYTITDLEKLSFDPMAYRYLTYGSHYRTKMNFTMEALNSAQIALEKMRKAYIYFKQNTERNIEENQNQNMHSNLNEYPDKYILEEEKNLFYQAIYKDLNMPIALSHVWAIIKKGKKLLANHTGEVKENTVSQIAKIYLETLDEIDQILGLNLKQYSEKYMQKQLNTLNKDSLEEVIVPEEIKDMIKERFEAKQEKNYEKADIIRKKIDEKGYIVIDTKEGVKIERK